MALQHLFIRGWKQLSAYFRYFLVPLYYEEARSDSGKYDNASSLSGGFGDRVQGPKTIG